MKNQLVIANSCAESPSGRFIVAAQVFVRASYHFVTSNGYCLFQGLEIVSLNRNFVWMRSLIWLLRLLKRLVRIGIEKEKPPGLVGGISENLNLRLSTGLECEAGFSGYWVISLSELDSVKIVQWRMFAKSKCPRFQLMEKFSVGLKLLTYRDEDAMVSAIIAPSGKVFII